MIFSFLCPGFIGMSSIMSYSGGRAAVEIVVGEGDKTEDSRRVWGGCLGQPEIHARPSCRRDYVWTIVITTSLVVNGRFHARSCARSCAQCHGEKARRHTRAQPFLFLHRKLTVEPTPHVVVVHGRLHRAGTNVHVLRSAERPQVLLLLHRPRQLSISRGCHSLRGSNFQIGSGRSSSVVWFGGNLSIPRVCVIAKVCFYFVNSYNRR